MTRRRTRKQIDTTTDGREGIEKGIYALEGETLKLCLSTRGGARPKEFATRNGTDLMLIVLKPGSSTIADPSPDVPDVPDQFDNPRARAASGWASPDSFTTSLRKPSPLRGSSFGRMATSWPITSKASPGPRRSAANPFPKALLEEWEGKKSATPPEGQVYLAISPGRGELKMADKAGPLPKELAGKAYDDPLVMKAYLNYCRRAIEFFKPDYLAIGIEVNEIYRDGGRKKWDAYVALHQHVYTELKKDHKDLPIFASWTLHQMFQQRGRMLEEFQKLMPYNDLVAVSYYPFFVADKDRLAALDWMTAQFDSFKKPYAIVETNDAAERLPLPKAKSRHRGHSRKAGGLLPQAPGAGPGPRVRIRHQLHPSGLRCPVEEDREVSRPNCSSPGAIAACSTRTADRGRRMLFGRSIFVCRKRTNPVSSP